MISFDFESGRGGMHPSDVIHKFFTFRVMVVFGSLPPRWNDETIFTNKKYIYDNPDVVVDGFYSH